MDPHASTRLIGHDPAWCLIGAAGRVPYHDPRLFDDRIDGETREHHHQR